MINRLTKNGVTQDKVFVEDGDMGWERLTLKAAKKSGCPIIKCSYCESPATTVDHSWPYLTEATHCEEHHDWMKHFEERCKNILINP